MRTRQGQFTIPNMAGVAVLFFIFAVVGQAFLFDVINSTAQQLLKSGGQGQTLTAVVLYGLPAAILISIFVSPFALSEVLFQRKRRRREERRERR